MNHGATEEEYVPEPDHTGTIVYHRMYWWREALIMAIFYGLYSMVRNLFGSTTLNGVEHPMRAFNNAIRVIRIEEVLGLFHEESVQDFFLQWTWVIKAFNVFYGTAHFIVTIGVFIVLYRYRKGNFHLFRNALAATTALAIVGFSLFPLMPPRLLDVSCRISNDVGDRPTYGGACYRTDMYENQQSFDGALRPGDFNRFGFVDTLETVKGLWSFNNDAMQGISNQYAAMPSLHIAWSTWCAFGLWPLLRRRWTKIAVLGYPVLTFLCITATGNHYWLDAIGGLVTLGIGFSIAKWAHRFYERRLERMLHTHHG